VNPPDSPGRLNSQSRLRYLKRLPIAKVYHPKDLMRKASNATADPRLLRGVAVGLGFEAVMVLAVYAVWHLLHLVR
jgi:hypothetical protein